MTFPPCEFSKSPKAILRHFALCARLDAAMARPGYAVVKLLQDPMKRTLQVLNELERDGVVEHYAIGEAMAATFYVEPLLTFDLDVFVILPQNAANLLSLAPLYEALRGRGYAEEGECVLIEGVPVQFLPAYNALLEEALREARETPYEEVFARVVRAEHLIAICLQTGRDKDRERVRILREQADLDMNYLAGVLQRHGLEGKWKPWRP